MVQLGPALHRGRFRTSYSAAPVSNPVSTLTNMVVSSAYERDFANAVSGEGLKISTTTTTTTKKGYGTDLLYSSLTTATKLRLPLTRCRSCDFVTRCETLGFSSIRRSGVDPGSAKSCRDLLGLVAASYKSKSTFYLMPECNQ